MMILVVMILLTSCQSRKKSLDISEYRSAEVSKIDTNTIVSTEKQQIENISKQKKFEQKIKENDGDVIIKGKADTLKDFRYTNVVGNDTISDIFISGNADFIIKSKWKQSEKKEEFIEKSETVNFVAEIARKSVAQSTIKDMAETIKKKEVKVKSTGFTLPTYFIIGGALLLLAILFFLWNKFGGSLIDRFKNGKF